MERNRVSCSGTRVCRVVLDQGGTALRQCLPTSMESGAHDRPYLNPGHSVCALSIPLRRRSVFWPYANVAVGRLAWTRLMSTSPSQRADRELRTLLCECCSCGHLKSAPFAEFLSCCAFGIHFCGSGLAVWEIVWWIGDVQVPQLRERDAAEATCDGACSLWYLACDGNCMGQHCCPLIIAVVGGFRNSGGSSA